MKALIIGATGATGRDLVNMLLQDPDYNEVTIFVRRSIGIKHPKLSEILTDFDHPETVSDRITGDVLFSCLGTTLKAAGSKENQRHIDYGIPLQFAEIAKKNNVSKTVLLSAYGASAKSRIFYSRLKGELEEKIDGLGFGAYIVFKPGILQRKDSDRFGERLSVNVLHFLNKLGLFKKFTPLPTSLLAEKLVKASKIFGSGRHVIELDNIFSL